MVTVTGDEVFTGISSVSVVVEGSAVIVRTGDPTGPCCTHRDWPTKVWHCGNTSEGFQVVN
jgi:hypothetical protein